MVPLLMPALFQGGLSLIQMIRGMSMNPQRPTYNIPQEVNDKLAQNQMNLNARSASAGRAQDNLFANQATTLQNAQQAGGGAANQLLAGAMSQAQSNRGFENLSAAEREDYQRRLGGLGQAQSEMAGYRDRAFEINKMQPYQDAAAAKSALIEGGIQNMFGALQSFNPLKIGQNQQQPTGSPSTPQPTDPYNGLMRPFGQIETRNMIKPVNPMTGGYVPQSVTTPFWVPRGNGLMFRDQDAYNSGVYQNNSGRPV